MPPAAAKKTSRSSFVPMVVAGMDRESCSSLLERLGVLAGEKVEFAEAGGLATRLSKRGHVGVVVVDAGVVHSSAEALGELLSTVRAVDLALPVFLVGDGLSGFQVASALRGGVEDIFFQEELGDALPEHMRMLISRRGARASGHLFPAGPGVPAMLGTAPSMLEVARLVERVAPSDATVLILGESGTGKELIARALHAFSRRSKGPFIAINCAAIPETLLENELFGHERGSFTGANAKAIGKVEAAEKGTLFLDEIGEMPIQLQSKILRLLQEKSYDRIGGTRTRKADIRIVAATNRELKAEVDAKRFREDLYYRLSVVPIPLPALREKPEDIPVLVGVALERLAEKLSRPGLSVSEAAMARLVAYRWPGNVRELENELERAAVLSLSDKIQPTDLELRARVEDPDASALSRLASLEGSLSETVELAAENARKIRVSVAMDRAGGDRVTAASALGIPEKELDELLGA